jgi:hypothetical protein
MKRLLASIAALGLVATPAIATTTAPAKPKAAKPVKTVKTAHARPAVNPAKKAN